jgi:hypothetical protein
MAQVNFNGTITATGQVISGVMDLPTARHNELPKFSDIQDDDILGGMDISDYKTKYMTIDQLRSKLIGEGIPQTPVLNNGVIELTVDEVHAETLRWDLPSITGKEFTLERRGVGMLQTTEYNILSTGGFLLTGTSPVMKLGETFILTLIQLQGGETEIINNSGSFITGIVQITTSTSWADTHKRKLINISGGTNKVVYTLPDLSDVEENTLIPIETNINNNFQSIINTSAGQLIYFGGSGYSQIVMGIGENLWVYRAADGWQVVASFGNYMTVGEVVISYKLLANTVIAEGQLLDRDAYPRLWAFAQSVGSSLVTEDDWNSDTTTYRGCFTTGPTGQNKFRVPDLRGAFPRFLDRGRGIDTDRADGRAGYWEDDQNKDHSHGLVFPDGVDDAAGAGFIMTSNSSTGGNVSLPTVVQASGGSESRPKNIGFLPLIKC